MNGKLIVSHLVVAVACIAIGFWLGNTQYPQDSSVELEQQRLSKQLDHVSQEKSQLEKKLAAGITDDLPAVLSESHVSDGDDAKSKKDTEKLANMQKMMLSNIEKMGRDTYAAMFEQMQMSEEEQDAFVSEFVAYNSHWMDRQYDIMGGSFNPDDLSDEQKQDIEQQMRQFGKDMKEDLNIRMADHFKDDFDQYDAYAQTVDIRGKLRGFAKSFRDPLDNYTREEVINIMADEQSANPVPDWEFTFDPEKRIQQQKNQLVGGDVWEKNVLDRSSSILTHGQLEDLKDALEKNRKQTELMIEMSELRLDKKE